LTSDRVSVENRPTVSLHRRNDAEGEIEMTETCVTLIVAEMHAAESKITARSENASSRNDATRETMITMIPSMTNLTDNTPQKVGAMKEELKLFPTI
jgi:hypothetical protein